MNFFSWLPERNNADHLGGMAHPMRRASKPRPVTRWRPCLEFLDDRCLPSGGVLDPTFGTAGVLTTNVGSYSTSAAMAVATYPSVGSANDGKVVAAGSAVVSVKGQTADDDFAVVRYNLNGSLDTSFGGTGQVLTDLDSVLERVEDVAVQSDGKIVATGYSGSQFALVRYNADGSLDTSFGGTGKILSNITRQSTDAAFRTSLQADGKIVVAGTTTARGTSNVDLFLVRYNSNGSLDTSFGTGGKVTAHFAYPLSSLASGQGFDLAIDPNTTPLDPNSGQILVVSQLKSGSGFGPVVVIRYTTSGSLDTSFGGGAGYVSLSTLNFAPAVAVQSDDRIVLCGNATTSNGFAVERLNAGGTPDATFGSGGLVVTPLPGIVKADALAIQADGKMVVAGAQGNSGTSGNFVVARYDPQDGRLDTSFGTGGIAISSGVAAYTNYQVDMALEPDGRIVAAGNTITSAGAFNIALARFLAAGPQIGAFTASPNSVTAGSTMTLTASSITDANPNSTITQVACYIDSNNDGILEPGTDSLLGYATQTVPGVWTFTFSVNLSPGAYILFAQAEDSYSVLGDPVWLALTVQ